MAARAGGMVGGKWMSREQALIEVERLKADPRLSGQSAALKVQGSVFDALLTRRNELYEAAYGSGNAPVATAPRRYDAQTKFEAGALARETRDKILSDDFKHLDVAEQNRLIQLHREAHEMADKGPREDAITTAIPTHFEIPLPSWATEQRESIASYKK